MKAIIKHDIISLYKKEGQRCLKMLPPFFFVINKQECQDSKEAGV